MAIRSILLVAGLAGALLAPAPLLAHESRTAEVRDRLSDPQTQMAASAALAAMSQAILDIDIAPFARAVAAAGGGDAVRDLPPDARLGDLAGPRGQRLSGDVARRVPQVMGSTAAMAGALDAALPELEASLRRIRDSLPRR